MSLSLRGLGYRYPSASSWSVSNVDLTVSPGELVLLTGPTGCGKSTLLRLAAGLVGRHGQGELAGEARVLGEDPARMAPSRRVRALGFLGQEPGDQLVAGTVGDELAFAMESAGWPAPDIEAALPGLLARVGLEVGPDHDPRALSGGQAQRLALGAALGAGARVVLLDEPLAWLDPAGARALLERLEALAAGGVAVLMVEHRLELCWPHVSRLVLMAEGRVEAEARPAALGPGHPLLARLRALGLELPGPLDLDDRLHRQALGPPPPTPPAPSRGAPLRALRGHRHRYPGAAREALRGVDLAVHEGERVAILGANGAGKSTLLAALAEAEGPRALAVPQDPDLALFCATVSRELAYAPVEARCSPAEVQARVQEAAGALSVEALLASPPQALSRGQRLRVAVAAALTARPRVLLLDEPTAGQDRAQVERLMGALAEAMAGGALVMATHDVDLALRHATRVVVLDAGRVALDLPAQQALEALDEALLPPLLRRCRALGLPPLDAAALAGVAAGSPDAARPTEEPRP